jgi:hypothetical protein
MPKNADGFCFSIRDCARIISTAASVSPCVIGQICLQNMKMRAQSRDLAREKLLGGGAITDGITDAKHASGNGP